ncbi:MAG: tRNA (adenosine(37)-N6)-threonylcarbamoyltransferase complex dimerization subunit type 1 TsaB [Candidatus Altimarinota bacterium]
MKTLFLNTVTPHTTIALFEGNQVVAEKRWKSELNEAETLQPAVEALLKDYQLTPDDIQQLIVCVGPGGFTSSRIGVSVANAWVFAKHTPVAQVSVFDLYDLNETVLLISANANEAWVRFPGEEPRFMDRTEFATGEVLSPSLSELRRAGQPRFQFSGLVHEEWKQSLEELGGTYVELEEQLPSLDGLEFRHEIVKPWYYKEANITWSDKNSKSIKK